ADSYTLCNGRAGQVFAGLEKVFDFPEYPWVSDSGPADHNAVDLILHAPCRGFLHTIHVAVPEYGNTNPRISFDRFNQAPISLSFIQLCAGTSVDTQRLNAHIL